MNLPNFRKPFTGMLALLGLGTIAHKVDHIKEPKSVAKPEEMQGNPGRGLASRRRRRDFTGRIGLPGNGRQHVHAGGPYKGQWH